MSIEVSAIGLVTAALAGAISFVSPCVLPLVPGYLSFVSNGVDPASSRLIDRFRVTWPALCFVTGFTTVFVLLGLGAQALGGLLLRYSAEANLVGGLLVVVFGLMMTGLFKIPFLMREFRSLGPRSVAGPGSAYVLGLAFAFGWTPCIGPVLGSILTVSAMSASSGAVLLAAYGLGLGVPFLLAALLFGNAAAGLKRLRYTGRILNLVAGAVMITMGVLMMTGRLQLIAFWLLERFPRLGSIG
ncbi:Cytochrome c biogenesis protein, transmembrane region [Mesorhizobium delmotii]|uniref:Cytochrome c biogenesis protein, transmembrane region n=1 Tax=Mesorhizobium delmotii TaxID=1631247 RepID=A0A2P9ARG9_9HYPH|nr:Cytochrome c biogenesis protein, transmembrane region [Mesorhizobium delmotii]